MPAPAEPITTPQAGPSRLVRVALVVLTAIVLPAIMVCDVVVKSPELSVLDEPVHLDYLRRIEQGEVPRIGDYVLLETVRDVQCKTVQGRTTAPCDLPLQDYDPDMLGASGYSYEAQQPPLYYLVTAGLRKFTAIGPADDFVTTARLTGVAWLSAGLLVLWLAARRLHLGWWPTAVAVSLLSLSPGILYQSATVNNDAAAVLTGSLALLMFAELRNRVSPARVAGWATVTVAVVLIKPTGIIAIAAAVAALFVDAAFDRRLSLRSAMPWAVPLLVGIVAYAGWGVVRDARAVVDYDVVLDSLLAFKKIDYFPLADVVAGATRLLGSYGGGAVIAPRFVSGPATLVVYAMVAAGLSSLWRERGGDASARIAGPALLALVVGGPAFTVLFYLDYSIGGGPSGRYGLSLLPLLAAGTAGLYRTRRAMVALSVLALLVAVPLLIAINYPTTRGS